MTGHDTQKKSVGRAATRTVDHADMAAEMRLMNTPTLTLYCLVKHIHECHADIVEMCQVLTSAAENLVRMHLLTSL